MYLARARAAAQKGDYAAARKALATITTGRGNDPILAAGVLALQNQMAAVTRRLQTVADKSVRSGDHVRTTRTYLRLLAVAGDQSSGAKART